MPANPVPGSSFNTSFVLHAARLVSCGIIFSCVCAYLFADMRAFQWMALGSIVGSAAALTPESVFIDSRRFLLTDCFLVDS
jgi:hypothetical protein